jgi:DNA polymerase V
MDDSSSPLATLNGVSIHSGFPNPATDRTGPGTPLALDLNRLLIRHPSSTYLFKIAGHGWEQLGIFDCDIALIDRALPPHAKDLVIAWQASGFRFCRWAALQADDVLWGVVSAVIHPYQL